jgi:hypothetical protein
MNQGKVSIVLLAVFLFFLSGNATADAYSFYDTQQDLFYEKVEGTGLSPSARAPLSLPDCSGSGISHDGSITITSITPPVDTVLEVGHEYTFDVGVSYQFDEATSGIVGIYAHDSLFQADNLDNQTQNGAAAGSSGTANVSVTATVSRHTHPFVWGVDVTVALFPTGYTCSEVSDHRSYATNYIPVGYSPAWLIVTLVLLTMAGGYLLRRRIPR